MKEKSLLHIKRELGVILFKLRRKVENPDLNTVIHAQPGGCYAELVEYFIDSKLGDEDSYKLWCDILAYRGVLASQYGDRVSIHITFYHFTRDPDAIAKTRLPENVRCSNTAQKIAFLEMRGWWENNSQTGLQRSEIMLGRLQQEILSSKKINATTSLMIVQLDQMRERGKSFRKGELTEELRIQTLQILARTVTNLLRSSDVVGHYNEDAIALILPKTPSENCDKLWSRIEPAFLDEELPCEMDLRTSSATFPEDAEDAKELLMITEDALAGKPADESTKLRRPRTKKGGIRRKVFLKMGYPVTAFFSHPVNLLFICILIGAAVWFNINSDRIFKRENPWHLLANLELNKDGILPGWQYQYQGQSSPFGEKHLNFHDRRELILRENQLDTLALSFPIKGLTRIAFDLQLTQKAAFAFKIHDHTNTPLLHARIARDQFRVDIQGQRTLWINPGLERLSYPLKLIIDRNVITWHLGKTRHECVLAKDFPDLPSARLSFANAAKGTVWMSSFIAEQARSKQKPKSYQDSRIDDAGFMAKAIGKSQAQVIKTLSKSYYKATKDDSRMHAMLMAGIDRFLFNQNSAKKPDLDALSQLIRSDDLAVYRKSMYQYTLWMRERFPRKELIAFIQSTIDNSTFSLSELANWRIFKLQLTSKRNLVKYFERTRKSLTADELSSQFLLEKLLMRSGDLDEKVAIPLWKEYFLKWKLIPPDRLYRTAKVYINTYSKSSHPENFMRSFECLLRNWRESPRECLALMRRVVDKIDDEELETLLKNLDENIDTNLIGWFLRSDLGLKRGDHQSESLLRKIKKITKEHGVLLAESDAIHARHYLHNNINQKARRNLLRLTRWNGSELADWAKSELEKLQE